MVIGGKPDLGGEELRRYFVALDCDLHKQILQGCRNRFLLSALTTVYDHNHRIRILVSKPFDRNDNSVEEHIGIMDAMLERNETLVEQRTRHHIEESRRITFEYFL
ncbi:MAG: FCD domain-containing protein [Methylobacteriaceae bacterium]|nr:FCD domain-containing protein [Methylobacteriaceae bacterium]